MTLPLLLIVGLAFVSGALLVLGLASRSSDGEIVTRRLRAIREGAPAPKVLLPQESVLEQPMRERLLGPLMELLAAWGARLYPATALQLIRAQLDQAGNPGGLSPAQFAGLRLASILLFTGIGLAAMRGMGGGPMMQLLVLGACALIGSSLPGTLLQRTIAARQQEIRKQLPDALDLITVGVEAGSGFDGAMQRVAQRMRGPLAQEMSRVLDEMRIGKSRAQALKEMAARCGLPELSAFASAVIQAEQMGMSLGRVLRVQGDTARQARLQQVREAAAKLPVKLLFPLVFFIFPAVFVALLGPGMVNLIRGLALL